MRLRVPLPSLGLFALTLMCATWSTGDARATEWTPVFQTPSSEIVRVLSSPDDETCWFITNFDRLYKTSDGGESWTHIDSGVFIPFGLVVVDGSMAFKTSSNNVWKTTNGGVSWRNVLTLSGQSGPPEVLMVDSTVGYVSYGGVLRRTTDGGESWSTSGITQPPLPVINSFGEGTLWLEGNNLWVGLVGDGVAHSPDGAMTWTVAENDGLTFTSPPHISFATPSFGIAIIHPSRIVYTTTDGGDTWLEVDDSFGLNQDVVAKDSRCWYIPNPADHFYVKRSDDAGATWTIELNDPAGFENMERSRSGSRLWVGTTTGRIYRYDDDADPSGIVEGSGANGLDRADRLHVLPNPSSGSLQLAGNLAAPAREFRLLAVDGRLVTRGPVQNGRVELQSVARGTYLLEALGAAGRSLGVTRVVLADLGQAR